MKKKRLGVNIDHVATIRNARGGDYPNPLKAALIAEKNGADSITIHLREDRRHIKDKIISQVKFDIETFNENELPAELKKIQPIKPGSRNLSK